ncbi:plasmid recombination protein [Dermabacter hominis]|uniref:plasmid recombination protein n=1 Tax=Dermabacter hominis TaxID=36740 RepID=UPI0021A6C842|nr:plasmid recombination protein [Dermabacter hominis]MCT1716396.1 plasmid recombination protein [Dermabacter hominis]
MAMQSFAPGAHFQKFTKADRKAVVGRLKHALRFEGDGVNHLNENIVETRTSWNRMWVYDEESKKLKKGTAKEAIARYDQLASQQAKGMRKNSVFSSTWVLQPSTAWVNEFAKDWRTDPEQRKKAEKLVMDMANSFIKAAGVRHRSVLGVATNLDESNPHVHIFVANVDFEEDGTLTPNWSRKFGSTPARNGKKATSGRAKLRKFHDDYRENMRRKDYEVTDQRVTDPVNLTPDQLTKLTEKIREEVEAEVAEEREANRQKKEQLDEREERLEKEKADVDEQRKKNVLERRHQQAREEIINKRNDESLETRKQLRRRLEEAETVIETVNDQKIKEEAQARIQNVRRRVPPPPKSLSQDDDLQLG